MTTHASLPAYGTGDASYQAAGGIEGLRRLADDFYRIMDTWEAARQIRDMHGNDLADISERLAYFLSGWLGGPRLYQQHYGPIRLPHFHASWPIGDPERNAWLDCMAQAIELQPYSADFKVYLLQQLRVPAERIVQVQQQ